MTDDEAFEKAYTIPSTHNFNYDPMVLKSNLTNVKSPHKIPNQYTHIQFAELLAKTIHQIQELSRNKGEEYTGYGDDRLVTFRGLAKELNIPMETVWAVYAKKHWNAVMTYIHEIQNGLVPVTRLEHISGRLDDLIVYCILFKAMVEEREGK